MQDNRKENILITGGSGYVGKILLEKLVVDDRVEKIVVIDKELLKRGRTGQDSKIIFIHKNLVDNWEQDISDLESENGFKITKVVHLAWQIRTMYGKQKLQNHWNIDGSQKVFEFVKNNKIKTFIHFSTVASYGAMKENTFEKVFLETDNFRKTNYLYAEEKRIVEENLDRLFIDTPGQGKPSIFVIRPASITGPRGRERTSFGLQSALAGKIKSKNFVENFIFKVIKKLLNFMPATSGWARQFVYEEDIVNAVLVMVFLPHPTSPYKGEEYSAIRKYNLCPTSAMAVSGAVNFIDAKEMSIMLNKKVIFLHPQFVRIMCFFAWHLTLGKIPTSSGVWKAYSYPIIVDGAKIEKDFPSFKYQKDIRQAYRD